MATIEETIYENLNKEVEEPQVNNPAPETATPQDTETEEKDNLRKRLLALGGAIFAGGATGATLAAILGNHPSSKEEEEVFQIIDEDEGKTFEEAFQDAREQLGPGAAFRWHGGVYSTYTEEEWNSMSPEERDAYNQKVQPLLTEEDQNADNYHHHTSDAPASETVHTTTTRVVNHTDQINIAEEEETELNGHKVIMATGTHNGKPMVMIDLDHDGTYDVMVEDKNGDGEISEDEYTDISDRQISVQMPITHEPTPGPTPVNNDWEIIEEGETELEGRRVIVAVANHNGERAVLIDVDRDGHYDIAVEDSNHDGQITQEDYHDIRSQGVSVQDHSLVTGGGGQVISNEDPVVEIDYSTETRIAIDDEGNEAIGAVGTVDGKPAIVVDINRDGSYDRAIVDDGNGGKDVVNIASADARVHDMSLVDSKYSQASLENQDDTTPDYTHTLENSEKGTTENDYREVAEEDAADTDDNGESTAYDDGGDDDVANHYNEMAFGDDSMVDTTDGMMDYGLDA